MTFLKRWITVCLFLSMSSYGAELTIDIVGSGAQGQLYLAIYEGGNKKGWSSKPVRLEQTLIDTNMTPTLIVGDLPPGKYAIRAFIDLNDNKILDKNGMGIPKEPVAVSSDSEKGKPSRRFSKAVFTIQEKSHQLVLYFKMTKAD
jgi:uncharacterized protein (DUF2141 family)